VTQVRTLAGLPINLVSSGFFSSMRGRKPIYEEELNALRSKKSVELWQRGLKEGLDGGARCTTSPDISGGGRHATWADQDSILERLLEGNNRTLVEEFQVVQDYRLTSDGLDGDKKSTRKSLSSASRGSISGSCAPASVSIEDRRNKRGRPGWGLQADFPQVGLRTSPPTAWTSLLRELELVTILPPVPRNYLTWLDTHSR
jgi:hypothetical protein